MVRWGASNLIPWLDDDDASSFAPVRASVISSLPWRPRDDDTVLCSWPRPKLPFNDGDTCGSTLPWACWNSVLSRGLIGGRLLNRWSSNPLTVPDEDSCSMVLSRVWASSRLSWGLLDGKAVRCWCSNPLDLLDCNACCLTRLRACDAFMLSLRPIDRRGFKLGFCRTRRADGISEGFELWAELVACVGWLFSAFSWGFEVVDIGESFEVFQVSGANKGLTGRICLLCKVWEVCGCSALWDLSIEWDTLCATWLGAWIIGENLERSVLLCPRCGGLRVLAMKTPECNISEPLVSKVLPWVKPSRWRANTYCLVFQLGIYCSVDAAQAYRHWVSPGSALHISY